MPESRKLAKKIWCTLAYIIGICWGNCTKLSYLICPLRGIKCPHLILGVLLPKNFGPEKRSFQLAILRLYCRYLQIGTRHNQVENGAAFNDYSHIGLPNLVNLSPQMAKWDRFSTHSKSTFGRSYLSS